MRMSPEGDAFKFELELKYDKEHGELLEIMEGEVKEVVKIRQQMYDKATIQAVIFELERRGYTVLHPEGE